MKKAIIINPDGTLKPLKVNDYRDLQKAVNGLITTAPNCNPDINDSVAYANDEGLLIGMEPNHVAMAYLNYPMIVGPVVIAGPINNEGDTTDVTTEIIEDLMNYAEDSDDLGTLTTEEITA